MKLANIQTGQGIHLALSTPRGAVDVQAAGCPLSMTALLQGADLMPLRRLLEDGSLPVVAEPRFADVVERPGKLLCVGLNYRDHTKGIHMKLPEKPVLFSKFNDALAPHGAAITLPPWEQSYDYEAELVIVMGRRAWGLSAEEAMACVFGYTCGNDLSCRDAQMRSGQWLIGKTMPGFGPCGPWVVTADEFDPDRPHRVRSRVNGELRQDGSTADMIFRCAEVIAYASHYVCLEPGDLIFTGTPSGVALEQREDKRRWVEPGDRIEVEIEGIGTLENRMV